MEWGRYISDNLERFCYVSDEPLTPEAVSFIQLPYLPLSDTSASLIDVSAQTVSAFSYICIHTHATDK